MVYEHSIFHTPWTGSPFLSDRPQSLNSLEMFSLILEFSSATLGSWDRDCSSLRHTPFEIIAIMRFPHCFLVTSSFSSLLTYFLSVSFGTVTRCMFNPFVFNVLFYISCAFSCSQLLCVNVPPWAILPGVLPRTLHLFSGVWNLPLTSPACSCVAIVIFNSLYNAFLFPFCMCVGAHGQACNCVQGVGGQDASSSALLR